MRYPLEFVINKIQNDININRIHASPISTRFNLASQEIFGSAQGRNYKLLAVSGGVAIGILTTCVAVAETITSLAYATLVTLIHTLTLFRSPSLQNHVIKSWAFCRHSFLMVWTPILLFTHESNQQYDNQLRYHFYKINCAQAAQSIGRVFDFFACRKRGSFGIACDQTEVGIEGLANLINQIKPIMPDIRVDDVPVCPYDEIANFDQQDFIQFLKNSGNLKSVEYNQYFTHFNLGDAGRKDFVYTVAKSMILYYRQKRDQNPNRVVEGGGNRQGDDLRVVDVIDPNNGKKPDPKIDDEKDINMDDLPEDLRKENEEALKQLEQEKKDREAAEQLHNQMMAEAREEAEQARAEAERQRVEQQRLREERERADQQRQAEEQERARQENERRAQEQQQQREEERRAREGNAQEQRRIERERAEIERIRREQQGQANPPANPPAKNDAATTEVPLPDQNKAKQDLLRVRGQIKAKLNGKGIEQAPAQLMEFYGKLGKRPLTQEDFKKLNKIIEEIQKIRDGLSKNVLDQEVKALGEKIQAIDLEQPKPQAPAGMPQNVKPADDKKDDKKDAVADLGQKEIENIPINVKQPFAMVTYYDVQADIASPKPKKHPLYDTAEYNTLSAFLEDAIELLFETPAYLNLYKVESPTEGAEHEKEVKEELNELMNISIIHMYAQFLELFHLSTMENLDEYPDMKIEINAIQKDRKAVISVALDTYKGLTKFEKQVLLVKIFNKDFKIDKLNLTPEKINELNEERRNSIDAMRIPEDKKERLRNINGLNQADILDLFKQIGQLKEPFNYNDKINQTIIDKTS